jgi:hypothetical protein
MAMYVLSKFWTAAIAGHTDTIPAIGEYVQDR